MYRRHNHDGRTQSFFFFPKPPIVGWIMGAGPTAVLLKQKNGWTNSQWTVPINATVAQLLKFGKLPIQFQLGGRYYPEKPNGGPDWGVRFAVTFLISK